MSNLHIQCWYCRVFKHSNIKLSWFIVCANFQNRKSLNHAEKLWIRLGKRIHIYANTLGYPRDVYRWCRLWTFVPYRSRQNYVFNQMFWIIAEMRNHLFIHTKKKLIFGNIWYSIRKELSLPFSRTLCQKIDFMWLFFLLKRSRSYSLHNEGLPR